MDYQATDKLKLNTSFTYNNSEFNWDWKFGDRPSLIWSGSALDPDAVTEMTNYDSTAQNDLIDEYSDLSYEQYEVVVGGTYQFTEALYASASFTYDIFKSDEEYVYGDEDGRAYFSYLGVGYRF